MKLVIGNKKYSSWSMRPWVAMKHFGIDFEECQLALFTETWKQDIAAYNSMTVPVLVTGSIVVADSLAIMETLAETQPKMWPQDPELRAKAREACAIMHSGFFAMRSEMHMNCSAVSRKLAISSACRDDLDKVEALWQRCFAAAGEDTRYLFGDFSIADAFFAPVVVRMRGYVVDLQPLSKAYVTRMLANPAIAEWVALGDAESVIIDAEEVGADAAV